MIFKVAALFLLCAGINAIPLLNTSLPVVLPEYTALGFYYQINNGPGLNQVNNGFVAKLFLGLPYAKPPVGNLRFEKPQQLPHQPWKIVRANAWPKACWQVVDATSMGIHADEDCLFLNVMRPAAPNLKPLPVLVFIHGGGYEYGYTEEYGYKYFVDNFVTQGLIVVTLQYRLAHFGFMATEDGVINGNYGHFDQVEALKFVKRNIHRFGGDPNKITLAGHSAGSVSVHSLSLSPHTVGLYNQEIHIAGSNYAQWPIDNKIVFSHSKNISDAVGCTQVNTHARKACLKNTPIQAFFDARIALNLTDFPYDVIDILYWTSVYDQDFFAGKNLTQLQQAAPKRRTLYGYDAAEGLLWSFYSNNPITNVFAVGRGFKSNERQNCDLQFIRDFLEQILFDSRFTPTLKDQVKADILEWYQIAPEYVTNDLYYFDKLTELYSDLIMKVPTGKEINAKIGYGWDHQYLFAFNYTRPQDRAEIGHLPGHGYFLMYFAGLEIYTNNGINQTAVDTQLQHDLAEMFITFVKTGKPSANGVSAPKITSPDNIAYLEFNPNVVVEDVDLKARTAFWDQLAVKYGWDFVRGIPL